jgi:prepilin-type N-terminal cleavage/methylation domain-containing protein
MLQPPRPAANRGFTMIEMAIVLAIVGILAAILTPIVTNYVDQSRVTKAQSDVRTIGEAIGRFERDVGRYPMWTSATGGNAPLQDTTANVVTLRGVGNLPSEPATTAWTSATPSDTDCSGGCTFDTIQNQLLTNNPSYTTNASLSKPFKWKGPYMDLSSNPDPWGNTYLVNIIHCKSTSNYACFVLDAGPNGQVETAFDISRNTTVTAGGDDVIYRIK